MENFEQILKVVRRHHLMTIATVSTSGLPWVAHAFYAWVPELAAFVFTTDPATRHGSEMLAGASGASGASGGARVAAGIALETRVVGRVQGIQIEGEVFRSNAEDKEGGLPSKVLGFCADRSCKGEEFAAARRAYLKRFPYAAAMNLTFWLLTPTSMKLTDNTLGFGTKLTWKR